MPDDGMHGEAAFPNDTKGDSDGPTWIQTATGGDNPQTAGGTPTEYSHMFKRPTERSEGGSNKPKDTRP